MWLGSENLGCKIQLRQESFYKRFGNVLSLNDASVKLLHKQWTQKTDLVVEKWITGEGNGNPLQYLCPENPMDREAQ